MFSDRFDRLAGTDATADDAALRVAATILTALQPYAADASQREIDELVARYIDD